MRTDATQWRPYPRQPYPFAGPIEAPCCQVFS